MIDVNALAFALLTPQDRAAPKTYAAYSVGAENPTGGNNVIPPFLAAGGTFFAQTQIEDDADFVALTTGVMGQITTQGASQGFLPILVDVEISGRRIFDRPIPLSNFAMNFGSFSGLIGPSGSQHRLPWPIRIPRNAFIKGFFQNLDTVNAYTCQLVFEGFHIYRDNPNDKRVPY